MPDPEPAFFWTDRLCAPVRAYRRSVCVCYLQHVAVERPEALLKAVFMAYDNVGGVAPAFGGYPHRIEVPRRHISLKVRCFDGQVGGIGPPNRAMSEADAGRFAVFDFCHDCLPHFGEKRNTGFWEAASHGI